MAIIKPEKIMKEHVVQPVAQEVAKDFESIVKKADKDIKEHGLD